MPHSQVTWFENCPGQCGSLIVGISMKTSGASGGQNLNPKACGHQASSAHTPGFQCDPLLGSVHHCGSAWLIRSPTCPFPLSLFLCSSNTPPSLASTPWRTAFTLHRTSTKTPSASTIAYLSDHVNDIPNQGTRESRRTVLCYYS